jgi:hypothetical protein
LAFEEDCALEGPFPHPIEDGCRFRLRLGIEAAGEKTILRIIDLLGHEVAVLYEGTPGPGSTDIRWDRSGLHGARSAPGFYIARLDVGGRRIQRRIFLEP